MKHTIGAVALAFVALTGSSIAASASETGLASIHGWRKVGKKTCLVDHYHNGNGSGPSRRLAERAAISSWTDFTVFEYGSSWGSYGLSVAKKMSCGGSGSNWQCSVDSIACRPW